MPSAPSVGPEREKALDALEDAIAKGEGIALAFTKLRHALALPEAREGEAVAFAPETCLVCGVEETVLVPHQTLCAPCAVGLAKATHPPRSAPDATHLNALAKRFDVLAKTSDNDTEREAYTLCRNHVLLCLHPLRAAAPARGEDGRDA